MTLIKSIAIEKPCGQSWQQMTEVNSGRHCDHCCKTVVDFTKMTDSGIVEYLSPRTNICGRFYNHQLNSLNQSLSCSKSSLLNWKSWGLAAMILGFSQYVKADANETIKVEQSPYQNKYEPIDDSTRIVGKVAAPGVRADSSRIVRGRVIAQEDGLPIPGATIRIKGTNEGAVTNMNGEFKIEVRSTSDTLITSFVGYRSEEIMVSQLTALNTNVSLQSNTVELCTAVAGGLIVRRPFYARVWYKIKYAIYSIFH